MINFRLPSNLDLKKLLAIGAGLVALSFFLPGLPSFGIRNNDVNCQQMVQPNAKLKSDKLAQLMTKIKIGESKEKVRSLIKDPYCKLANARIRKGVESEREIHVLEDQVIQGEDNAKLIVMYEDDSYVGYRFLVR